MNSAWRAIAAARPPGRLAIVTSLEQVVVAVSMHTRKQFGQCIVDAPLGAGDRLGTCPLDSVEGGQNDRLPPWMFDQGAGLHDAFVSLPGQLGQQLDGLPLVAHREGLEAEHTLQLH